MRHATLIRLLRSRSEGRAVVWATRLTGDREERLIHPHEDLDETLAPGWAEAAGRALRTDRSVLLEDDDGHPEAFFRPYNPPLRLLIVGAVHIAQALSAMAHEAGFAVTVIDPRRAFASRERFPGVELVDDWPDTALEALSPDHRTAVVTLTHDPKLDDPALVRALPGPAYYVGSLGSRRTQQARRQRLLEAGLTAADVDRLHGPVGLDIGALSPAEIAVSILAQAVQVLRRGDR